MDPSVLEEAGQLHSGSRGTMCGSLVIHMGLPGAPLLCSVCEKRTAIPDRKGLTLLTNESLGHTTR